MIEGWKDWINSLRVGDRVRFETDGDVGEIRETLSLPRHGNFRPFLVRWSSGACTLPKADWLVPVESTAPAMGDEHG
jgi:hypothetical protein